MDWYDITEKFHKLTFDHECRLSSLPEEWQRELAALWRLEAEVNNGAYLQFLANWGRESYVYASQALKKIWAPKMAKIIDRCQALVDKHFNCEGESNERMQQLLPNQVIGPDGAIIKDAGSILPYSVVARINKLSYEFMSYPEDLTQLGLKFYGSRVRDHGLQLDTERLSLPEGPVKSVSNSTRNRILRSALWWIGWSCLFIAVMCLRRGRDDLTLLAAIGWLGSMYFSRKMSRDNN